MQKQSALQNRFLCLLNELNGYIYPNRLSLLYKTIGKIFENMANERVNGALENAISFYEKCKRQKWTNKIS